MSKMLSLLAYGKSLALNHGNSGAVFWSKDGKTMSYRGMPIVIAQFKKMVLDVMSDAEDMLWRDLMWTKDAERFEIPIDELEDDVTWTLRGRSFLDTENNKLQNR